MHLQVYEPYLASIVIEVLHWCWQLSCLVDFSKIWKISSKAAHMLRGQGSHNILSTKVLSSHTECLYKTLYKNKHATIISNFIVTQVFKCKESICDRFRKPQHVEFYVKTWVWCIFKKALSQGLIHLQVRNRSRALHCYVHILFPLYEWTGNQLNQLGQKWLINQGSIFVFENKSHFFDT